MFFRCFKKRALSLSGRSQQHGPLPGNKTRYFATHTIGIPPPLSGPNKKKEKKKKKTSTKTWRESKGITVNGVNLMQLCRWLMISRSRLSRREPPVKWGLNSKGLFRRNITSLFPFLFILDYLLWFLKTANVFSAKLRWWECKSRECENR